MNTIVLNLENLGVTEYSGAFTGLAGDFETLSAGLALVGGLKDDAALVVPSVTFSMALEANGRRLTPHYVYVFGQGADEAAATVTTSAGVAHSYRSSMVHDRAVRFVLGKGLRDNYLQLKIAGTGRAALSIDQLEFVTTQSDHRRL